MALTIPDIQSITNASNGYDFQAVQDSTDIAAVTAADAQTAYVLYGMQVTTDTSLTVNVAAGAYVINMTPYVYAGGTVTATSASATDRRDIVSINSSGTLTVTAGTACGTAGWVRNSAGLPPVKPAVPANQVLLGELAILSTTTTIAAINIVDKTVINMVPVAVALTATQSMNSTAVTAITGLNMPLVPSQVYIFEADLLGSNSSTSSTGISVSVAVPTGAKLNYHAFGSTSSAALKPGLYATTTTLQTGFITATGTGVIRLKGVITMSTATGSLQINYASSTGTTTAAGTATMQLGTNLIVFPL